MRTCCSAECGREGEVDVAKNNLREGNSCFGGRKLAVVGIGPGDVQHMTVRAHQVLKEANLIIGYKTYTELIKKVIDGKEIISSGMKKEVERCALAVQKAVEGRYVALVSSGDPGIYGMAGLALELIEREGLKDKIEVEIVPGLTAASAAAASLGAPLMHDFAVISLSDLMTPWEVIEKRLEAAAFGDFITVIYNPVSTKRTEQIKSAQKIFLKHRKASTPVGIVRNAKRGSEEIFKTDLEHFLEFPMDMFTVITIGNSRTYATDEYIITPRGYEL